MIDDKVKLVICVLMTDQWNQDIWEHFAEHDEISIVTHPKPEHEAKYQVETSIPTSWSGTSLVYAELYLYHTAIVRYPNVEHFLFVSGDSVPIQSAQDMLTFYKTDPRSHFKEYTKLGKSNTVKKTKGSMVQKYSLRSRRKNIFKLFTSDQFKCLVRNHVDFLLSEDGMKQVNMLLKCTFITPQRTGNFAYDEIVIPSILLNKFPISEFIDDVFVELLADNVHAKVLTLSEFTELYKNRSKTTQIIRKVTSDIRHHIISFLKTNLKSEE
jgi:hypothetical protein